MTPKDPSIVSADIDAAIYGITAAGACPNNMAHHLAVRDSQSISKGCTLFPDSSGNLFVLHPATRTFHKTLVTKNISDYVVKTLSLLKAGGCNNRVLSNLWVHEPYFLFVYLPPNYADIATTNLSRSWRPAKTARNMVNRDIFVQASLEHACGLVWPVIYQDGIDSSMESIYKRANTSLKSFARKHNQSSKWGFKIEFGRKFSFFNENNCKLLIGNKLTRTQMYSQVKASHASSAEIVCKYAGEISKSAAVTLPAKHLKCLTAIGCVSLDNVVGIRNQLLDCLVSKADMAFFRKTTMGGVVIMGRNTWDSLPEAYRPLPGRINAVVSTTMGSSDGVFTYPSLEAAVRNCKHRWPGKELFVIGGPSIWEQAFEAGYVRRALVTKPPVRALRVVDPIEICDLVLFNFDHYLQGSYLHARTTLQQDITDGSDAIEVFEHYL